MKWLEKSNHFLLTRKGYKCYNYINIYWGSVSVKEDQEKILTAEDVKSTEEENVRRVDKRPGSIYSIIIFAMLFLVAYLFYPQLTMLVPVAGEKLTVDMGYEATNVTEMLNASMIVVAECADEGKTQSMLSATNEPLVYKLVDFNVKTVLKGDAAGIIQLPEYGGNGLFEGVNSRKKKYTVTYTNAIDFEKGETYLLFISANGEVINGRAGALKMTDGEFTDIDGVSYTVNDIKKLLGE